MSHQPASTVPTAPTAQAPQSLGLDARRIAMLKATGVNWRWPAPTQGPDASSQEIPPAPTREPTTASQVAQHAQTTEALAAPSDTAPPRPPVSRAAPTPAPLTKQPPMALDGLHWLDLQQAASACQACGLAAGRVGHSWGQGNERAKWLFITPRLNPSDDGETTVQGDELALLQSLWQAMGLRETDVFVTSLTKCRAGLGLHASAEDTAQCLAYLQHQVRWLQPDMIVALGLPVAHALLGASDAPLAQWRGRIHEWQGTPTLVTYPLDVLLRRPVDKAKWWADLCLGLDHLTANETP